MLSQTPFLGYLYPFTFSPLWSGVWECNAQKHTLLLSCSYLTRQRGILWRCVIKSRKVVLLCSAFLSSLARGILWWCVIKSCKVVLLCSAFLSSLARGILWRCVIKSCKVVLLCSAFYFPWQGGESFLISEFRYDLS